MVVGMGDILGSKSMKGEKKKKKENVCGDD